MEFQGVLIINQSFHIILCLGTQLLKIYRVRVTTSKGQMLAQNLLNTNFRKYNI